MNNRAGKGWSGQLGGQGPVQGWGRVDGHSWYFRVRHQHWSLEIAEGQAIPPEYVPDLERSLVGW